MSTRRQTLWAERLRRAAALSLPDTPIPANPPPDVPFVDESGHRRAVDAPFFAWRSGERSAPSGSPGAPPRPAAPDVALWRALVDGSDAPGLLDAPPPDRPAPVTTPAGTIEVWTETELSALHALWWIAKVRGRPDLRDRCLLAADWHVEHLQPDNATNHPWAVHVFLIAAQQRGGSPEHELHAQAMLHNCQVNLGRPDRLSAHILADAADALEAESGPALA